MANAIEKYPVPLIFKKIMKDRMTGELIIIHDNFTKRLYFAKGRLTYAATTVEKERLGDVLLGLGKITQEQLTKLTKIKMYSQQDRRIGEILVDITPLSVHDIYFALLYQIKVIAISTFHMAEGEWRFVTGTPEIKNSQQYKIRLTEIITEGVKHISDFNYYKHRFAMRAPVTTVLPEKVQRYLAADQVKFFLKLSSFAHDPLTRIIPHMETDDKTFWRNIIAFYLLNIVDFVEFTIDETANRSIEEVNDLFSRIKNSNLDYYQLLGLKSGADLEEVKQKYFDYSKRFHPDRIIGAPDSTVKLRATEVFAEINRAYETIGNQEKKKQYDSHGFQNQPAKADEQISQTRKARNLFIQANSLYGQHKYFEASSLMEEAVHRDSTKASFYHLLGLCHSHLPATKNRAEICLKQASKMEPWNADHVFALGELYKSENLMKKAEAYFNKALEINMEHTLAGKAKADMDKLFSRGKKPLFSIFGKKK